MPRSGILVIGSANMDLVATTRKFPRPGETVFGGTLGMFPGGKGANQAVCCAKLGGRTYFIGKMGSDIFRDKMAASMGHDGVDLRHLLVDRHAPTGAALIAVDGGGQNQIIVVSGSNMKLTPADIRRRRGIFARASITLLQLEIPLETIVDSARLAKRHSHLVVLNPAPARPLPKSLLRYVDVLTPNETEAEILTGIPVHHAASAEQAAQKLLAAGVGSVIVTMGRRGCLLVTPDRKRFFPALRVKALDTTAAGDAFNGALVYSLSNGSAIDSAIEFANAVAAFSVTRMGAQSSMPTMKEMNRFLTRPGSPINRWASHEKNRHA